jgi:hypothetical protein
MTVAFESTKQADLAPAALAPADAIATRVAAARGALVAWWPPAVIGLGVILTLAWVGSLIWLLVRMVFAVV